MMSQQDAWYAGGGRRKAGVVEAIDGGSDEAALLAEYGISLTWVETEEVVLEGPELLAYLGTDATLWAAEFCKIARDHGINLDEGWMITWFANAIEQGREAGRKEAR